MEHPTRTLLRQRITKRNGIWYDWGEADCSQQIVDMVRDIAEKSGSWDMRSQAMYDAFKDRPVAKVLGALWLYGTSPTNIRHVRLAYDDIAAFGAEGGSTGTNTDAEAKSRCAFWRSCDPYKDSRNVYGPFLPDWYPFYRVTTANLNLRDKSSVVVGQIITELPANTVVTLTDVTEQNADGYTWVPVETADGMMRGWVAAEFLKR